MFPVSDEKNTQHECEIYVLINRRYNSREYIKCTPEDYLFMKRWEKLRTHHYIDEFIASLKKRKHERDREDTDR